jgi:antitoxin PrlF
MNVPRFPFITTMNRVQSKISTAPIEPMDAHLCVSRTLELLAADMNAHPELIQLVDKHRVARIISLVGQLDVDLNSPLSAEDE